VNRYSFEDLSIGMKESFSREVTASMLEDFCRMTGDVNPLHTDEDFARGKGFKDRVVYGLLTTSFLSTLAGVYLPGERSLIREVDVKMKKPVFVGDILTVTGEVESIREELGFFVMKVSIVNQNGDKVMRGTMQMGII